MGTSENVSRYGGGGIRTHGTLADTLVFKTRALNHSTTPPEVYSVVSELWNYSKEDYSWFLISINFSIYNSNILLLEFLKISFDLSLFSYSENQSK